MYLPEKFKETRPEVLHGLMSAHPLATLVVAGDVGIIANQIPMLTLASPAPLGVLCGHIARANPVWKQYLAGSEALAIFQGAEHYISPNFYATKQQSGEVVPTWNYAIVHARGPLQFTHDAVWLRELVGSLTNTHEAGQAHPWQVEDAPEAFIETQLKMIVGFEMTITQLVGKFKLSQNRNDADRQGVLAGLQAAGDPHSLDMAEMLSRE